MLRKKLMLKNNYTNLSPNDNIYIGSVIKISWKLEENGRKTAIKKKYIYLSGKHYFQKNTFILGKMEIWCFSKLNYIRKANLI